MFNKMAKSGGPNGHGSVSNLSSARQQNSLQYLSRGGLHDNGASSSRKIDYRNLDFGYKNKETPNIPGIAVNEHGKIDMAQFLNDNHDLINIEETDQPLSFDEKDLPKSARAADNIHATGGDGIQSKQFLLDLGKVYDQDQGKSSARVGNGFDVEAAFQQSSMSQRSQFFNGSYNQHILMKQQ